MSGEKKPAFPRITADKLRRAVIADAEIAVIDVRENAVHARDGHPLLSASIPLSRIELEIASAVPRLATEVVLLDAGDEKLALRAAEKLAQFGYSKVSILAGGAKAWAAAGYEVFTGSNVVGIAFGEFAEHKFGTPHISATALKAKLDRGENVVLLDSRTIPEFRNFSIPGAVDLPGAELVYRFHSVVPDPDALVVVNCAGRTRSIIGAQALINAGVPNRVVSLANGTMDWLINGYELQEGAYNFPGRPAGAALAKAREAGERLRSHYALQAISKDELAALEADRKRSLYIFDVRTEAEFLAGHVPGSRWAEGGQIVQGIQRWAATQNARVVLTDTADLVRASITASWLVQINWAAEVYILRDALDGALDVGPEPVRLAGPLPEVETITATELDAAIRAGTATVIDLDLSTGYRAGHIPGAHFAIRERLSADIGRVPGKGSIVVTSADGLLATFAAAELAAVTKRPVKALAGGTAAWHEAGLNTEKGETSLLHPAEDARFSPYQLASDAERFEAFRKYLAWEVGLVAQIERDGTAKYRVFPSQQEPAAAPAVAAE